MKLKGRQNSNHGERSGRSKLTATQVKEIRSRVGEPLPQLAAEFNVSNSLICQIHKNKIWKAV